MNVISLEDVRKGAFIRPGVVGHYRPPEFSPSCYSFLNSKGLEEVKQRINNGSLEGKVGELTISKDGRALSPSAKESEYNRLEHGLVNYIQSYSNNSSYGSVAFNATGDMFMSMVEYIDFLQQRFKTDAGKVKRLKRAVITAFYDKMSESAGYFMAPVRPLYDEIRAAARLKTA